MFSIVNMQSILSRPFASNSRQLVAALFLFAFLRGVMYASFLPPWGLVDEEQHFDYIKQLAEHQTIPIAHQTYLSAEVIASLFETKRWEKFHWPTPRSAAPMDMGLEGYSYEGYQPPLYYLASLPVYWILPDSILVKLYGLRWAMVFASLVTVWIAMCITREIFPNVTFLPYAVGFLLSVIPERTMATSRVNNDVLLEVLAALFLWVVTSSILKGLTTRRAQLLGLVFGLGVLTKISMMALGLGLVFVFWLRRRDAYWIRNLFWTSGLAAILILPLVIYNLQVYGDWSGFGGFEQLNELFMVFQKPALSVATLTMAFWDLCRHFWVIWWNSAVPGTNPILTICHTILAVVSIIGVVGLSKYFYLDVSKPSKQIWILLMFVAMGFAYAIVTLKGYFDGIFPVIQGRFLLPTIIPIVILLVWGIRQSSQCRWMLTVILGTLVWLDAIYLFGKLIPYFYYWSAFFKDGQPLPYIWPGWQAAWNIFYPRLLSDKPEGMVVVLSILIVAYSVLLIFVVRIWWHQVALQETAQDSHHVSSLPQSLSARLKQWRWIRDPLVWITISIFCLYLGWVALRPSGVFWSLDEGGKLIYLQNVLKTGHPSAPLLYPGRTLDPELRFVALYFSARRGEQLYTWWPVGFPLLTLPIFLAFGWIGLYILPALSGTLCAYFAGAVTRRLCPQPDWLAALGAILTGLATPVMFYGTTFWEHTPSAMLFLGSVFALLVAWQDHRRKWLVVAGILGSWSIFFRLDVGPMLFGIGLILLVLRWKDGVLFGTSLTVSSIPWLLANWRIMGHPFQPNWAQLMATDSFTGFLRSGEKYILDALFNAPAIGAFAINDWALGLGAALLFVATVGPFFRRLHWLAILANAGMGILCGWVLIQPEGYRSVHGFVLIAPHVVFASWLLATQQAWKSPFPFFLIAAVSVYGLVYLARGWVAAGGLQWGPRYMLALYPILVVASLVGLAYTLPTFKRFWQVALIIVFSVNVVIGIGFEVRGWISARDTMVLYSQSGQAIRQLGKQPIATWCTWLPMVVPDLYWNGNIFNVGGAQMGAWVENLQRFGVASFYEVQMLSCNTTPIDQVQSMYLEIPSGIIVREFQLGSNKLP